jgi:integrase/recombinase XerD
VEWTEWCATLGIDPFAARRVHVDGWRLRLTNVLTRAKSTVARKLSAVASLYGYAVAEDLLDASPTAHIRRPKVSRDSQTTGLTRAELATLRAAADDHSPRAAALVALLALNGLRVSEALAVQVDDLRSERGHRVLDVIRKGGARRTIPLAPPTVAAFELAGASRTSGPLIGLTRFEAYELIGRLARAAALPRISPHSLRHTFATLALDAGVPLHIVQDAMDHADPRTTQRYNLARHQLDGHATYRLVGYLAAA